MFVVFEGIDGSGKTTVSNKVAGKLRDTGLHVEHLREGGKFASRVTQAIREFGRDSRNFDLTPQAEFFLYVTRDVQLLDEMTRPALGKSDIVIADRFLYSAEIIGRFGRDLPEAWVRPVLAAAARDLEPDLVILVDIDPHIARARRRVAKVMTSDKRPPSRKGLSGVGMQQRFRAGYRELAAREPQRWVVVDNDQDLSLTVERVFALIEDAYKGGAPAAIERFRKDAITAPHRTPVPLSTAQDALAEFLRRVDQRAVREPHVAAYLLGGLFGAGADQRRKQLADSASDMILSGLSGLTDPVSWELRDLLKAKHPGRVARTLGSLARLHPRAPALRAELGKSVPVDVMLSMDSWDSDEAWALRDRLWGEFSDVVVGSLLRIDTPRAWALREKWLASKDAAAFTVYENARVICKSISGLDTDRAWDIRKGARDEAPISVVASLKGMMSDKAWKWRDRYLERAPKAVFDTISEVDDARAWDMRERLVGRCKEAVDSMFGLDGERAWKLRQGFADVWPSTVVKSLGALSSTPPGIKLIERQLRRYADNISLLKHAAAIALGAHLDPELGVD